jgi:3D (Asp-Asp-Asp) domain-containing protein
MSNKTLKMAKKAIKYAKKAKQRSGVLFITFAIFCSMSFPHNSMAAVSGLGDSSVLSGQLDEPSPSQNTQIQEYSILVVKQSDLTLLPNSSDTLPKSGNKKPIKMLVSASAYTSEVAQTDASPCVTANGFNVCKHGKEDIIATNLFPFGTKLTIPAYSGDKVYTVMDRMNSRYNNRPYIDLWFLSKEEALKFGRRTLEIEVFEMEIN